MMMMVVLYLFTINFYLSGTQKPEQEQQVAQPTNNLIFNIVHKYKSFSHDSTEQQYLKIANIKLLF